MLSEASNSRYRHGRALLCLRRLSYSTALICSTPLVPMKYFRLPPLCLKAASRWSWFQRKEHG